MSFSAYSFKQKVTDQDLEDLATWKYVLKDYIEHRVKTHQKVTELRYQVLDIESYFREIKQLNQNKT